MSALIELNPLGEQRHQTMIREIDRQSRPFSPEDLQLAVQHQQRTMASSSVRARSATVPRTGMPSGREEPDLRMLRPVTLSVMPAPGAAGYNVSPSWSMVGSDPEDEPDADAPLQQ